MEKKELLLKTSFVDLTHTLDECIPIWPNTERLQRHITKQNYHIESYQLAGGIGTHMDAPAHFASGGRTVDKIHLSELILPACVLNVTEKTAKNSDYVIQANDLLNWENTYSTIPAGSLFLAYTGWSAYWPDEIKYRNQTPDGNMHFPGFGKSAAELLIKRNVTGIGIDTLSLDPGLDHTFATHHLILSHDKFQLENLTNLALLPATGAIVFILPMKIGNAPEAPVRVIAALA